MLYKTILWTYVEVVGERNMPAAGIVILASEKLLWVEKVTVWLQSVISTLVKNPVRVVEQEVVGVSTGIVIVVAGISGPPGLMVRASPVVYGISGPPGLKERTPSVVEALAEVGLVR